MKLFKNKKVVLASAIVLGVAAVTSSALAAYIITGGTKKGTGTIDPSEVVVENNVLNLTVGTITDELIFRPENKVSSGVVTSEGGGKLTVNVPLTLTFNDAELDSLQFTIQVTEENSGTKASVAGYIGLPEGGAEFTKTATELGFGEGDEDGTLALTWTWGTEFDEKDPCAFYNDNHESDSNVIVTEMEAFETAINGATFTVTISVADTPSA